MSAKNTNIIYPDLSYKIMGAIFEIHKELGPGFLESTYEKALIEELISRGMKVEYQRVLIR
jgi:GxxExxY protein